MNLFAYTIRASTILNYIYSPVAIRPAGAEESARRNFTALWDTAAHSSAISKEVVGELGLEVETTRKLTSIVGDVYVPAYRVDVYLPAISHEGHRAMVKDIQVTETVRLPNVYQVDDNIDMLIGMDIISQGDMFLSHAKGRTEFRFRMPAQGIGGWD